MLVEKLLLSTGIATGMKKMYFTPTNVVELAHSNWQRAVFTRT